jgi:signal transduction histidine kinase
MLDKIKPKFWDYHDVISKSSRLMFNYRRIWKQAVLATAVVSLLPLIIITTVAYTLTQRAAEAELVASTSRLVSNTRRTIAAFLAERQEALKFIIADNSLEALKTPQRLNELLKNLQTAFGGFVDIGIIDAAGKQIAYAGPYELLGKDYSEDQCFTATLSGGSCISHMVMGFRRQPHLVITVKRNFSATSTAVLRSSIDTERFHELLKRFDIGTHGDVFIINRQGELQTPSRLYGELFTFIPLQVPPYSEHTQVYQTVSKGASLIVGYAFIPDTEFILMIVKDKNERMRPWLDTRIELIGFLLISVLAVLGVILGVSTFLVHNMFLADQKRLAALHHAEYMNKLASIGRMAASVAHEINNPLAVINEKAGLIKDWFTFTQKYAEDSRVLLPIDAILYAVKRAGKITKRMLTFARNLASSVEEIRIDDIIREVLHFLGKEAEYRNISIRTVFPEDLPVIQSDRGKLEQIFINIINNAYAAMKEGGHLDIIVSGSGSSGITVSIADDGCGIPADDIERIFEPFFSTKTGESGTGLGLSITYNLVHEIGGNIKVQSQVGKGTCFIIQLPLQILPLKENLNADTAG